MLMLSLRGVDLFCTGSDDAINVCIPQYRKGFLRLWRQAEMLIYAGSGWNDADAEKLAEALEWAHEQGVDTPAINLGLSQNELTDAALPRLITAVSAGAPELNKLWLTGNKLSDEGAQFLGTALTDGKLPKLTKLRVDENTISDAAKEALRAACDARGVNVVL